MRCQSSVWVVFIFSVPWDRLASCVNSCSIRSFGGLTGGFTEQTTRRRIQLLPPPIPHPWQPLSVRTWVGSRAAGQDGAMAQQTSSEKSEVKREEMKKEKKHTWAERSAPPPPHLPPHLPFHRQLYFTVLGPSKSADKQVGSQPTSHPPFWMEPLLSTPAKTLMLATHPVPPSLNASVWSSQCRTVNWVALLQSLLSPNYLKNNNIQFRLSIRFGDVR